jgi:hypothetical protein
MALKSSPAGILFPVLIALLVAMGRFFAPGELAALDPVESGEEVEGVLKEATSGEELSPHTPLASG